MRHMNIRKALKGKKRKIYTYTTQLLWIYTSNIQSLIFTYYQFPMLKRYISLKKKCWWNFYVIFKIEVYIYIYKNYVKCKKNKNLHTYHTTHLLFSEPDLDKSPFSSANLSDRNRESDGSKFLGAVSKLFILWAKWVNWNLSFCGVAATFHTYKRRSKIEKKKH